MPWGEIIVAVLGIAATILAYVLKQNSDKKKRERENDAREDAKAQADRETSRKLREALKQRNARMRKQREKAKGWNPE